MRCRGRNQETVSEDPLLAGLTTALQTVLDGGDIALGLNLGAVQSFCTAQPGSADGDTDITDFNLLAANFAPSGYSTSAVPEPSTMLLASLALVLVGVSFRLSKNDRD